MEKNYFKGDYVPSQSAVKMWKLSPHESLIEMKAVTPRAIALAAAKL